MFVATWDFVIPSHFDSDAIADRHRAGQFDSHYGGRKPDHSRAFEWHLDPVEGDLPERHTRGYRIAGPFRPETVLIETQHQLAEGAGRVIEQPNRAAALKGRRCRI